MPTPVAVRTRRLLPASAPASASAVRGVLQDDSNADSPADSSHHRESPLTNGTGRSASANGLSFATGEDTILPDTVHNGQGTATSSDLDDQTSDTIIDTSTNQDTTVADDEDEGHTFDEQLDLSRIRAHRSHLDSNERYFARGSYQSSIGNWDLPQDLDDAPDESI